MLAQFVQKTGHNAPELATEAETIQEMVQQLNGALGFEKKAPIYRLEKYSVWGIDPACGLACAVSNWWGNACFAANCFANLPRLR